MDKFGKAQSVTRKEDPRLLTGRGRYVADIVPEGALIGYVLRSPVAHARITGLDTGEAAAMPGVAAILTAADLAAAGAKNAIGGFLIKNRDGTKGAKADRPILAEGKVRHLGEPVAFVVADSLNAARDAAEAIEFDFEDLPAHVEVAPGGEDLHETAPNNVAFDFGLGDEDATEAALAGAAHVVALDIPDNRIIVASMEPRGCYAEMQDGRLHVSVNGQGVWGPKGELAKVLGLPEADIRVTNPDVGGGFGMKGMNYPEMFLCAVAARRLNRAVHWMGDRSESMLSDNAGRDLVTRATLGFDADYRLVGYKAETVCNLGAYNSQFAQPIQTELFSKVMPGTYDLKHVWLAVQGIYTNTTPVDAYRGAGRPEAIFVLERAMDNAARVLGVDPWELRRKSFIKPEQFPYESATGVRYDVGDFNKVLDRAVRKADRAGLEARKAASKAAGKLRGQGLCYYIESILGDPAETTTVVFNEEDVEIHVGTQSNGQGHETVFPQFLSDHTGIPVERIRFVQGDSDIIPNGGGTGGSRSVTVQNNATLGTVEAMTEAFAAYLGEKEGVDPGTIDFDDEQFRIPGSNLTPTMLEVAQMARQDGRTDLLRHSRTVTLDGTSFPNGAHVAEVEIDPETGQVSVDRYTVVDDFGVLINPMLAEGQVHGGVAQGLGQALTEQVVFDESGQLLSGSFMDYALPRADTMPWVAFHSEPTPSTYNSMGMKGCGEAGTVGALAAVTNAVADALAPLGVERVDMPMTPSRIWALMNEGDRGAS